MNRPKAIGTAAETAVVRYLHTAGWPGAERRALRGTADAGDITGTPGICWSVKGGEAARSASDLDITRWLSALATQIGHAQAAVGILVVQRRGVGPANAGRWWAIMPAFQLADLAAEPLMSAEPLDFPVRMLLADAAQLLRAAGYGTAPDCGHELHGADGGPCPGCGHDAVPIPTTPADVPPELAALPPMPAADWTPASQTTPGAPLTPTTYATHGTRPA